MGSCPSLEASRSRATSRLEAVFGGLPQSVIDRVAAPNSKVVLQNVVMPVLSEERLVSRYCHPKSVSSPNKDHFWRCSSYWLLGALAHPEHCNAICFSQLQYKQEATADASGQFTIDRHALVRAKNRSRIKRLKSKPDRPGRLDRAQFAVPYK